MDPVTVARGLSGYSLLSYVYSGEPHLVVVRNKWLHLTTLGMVPGRWETLGKRCLFSLIVFHKAWSAAQGSEVKDVFPVGQGKCGEQITTCAYGRGGSCEAGTLGLLGPFCARGDRILSCSHIPPPRLCLGRPWPCLHSSRPWDSPLPCPAGRQAFPPCHVVTVLLTASASAKLSALVLHLSQPNALSPLPLLPVLTGMVEGGERVALP